MESEANVVEELLEFFKALAEPNRLKIVGLLAGQPYSVEQLAAALGVSAPTVSHHLAKLQQAGLASAAARGYYSIYSLEIDALRSKARRLLSRSELPRLAQGADLGAYDRRVLAAFTDAEGRVTRFPAQQAKFRVLLRHVLDAFEPGVRYSERQVNDILARFSDDTARLRRGLVEYHLMAREGGGGEYWRVEAEA